MTALMNRFLIKRRPRGIAFVYGIFVTIALFGITSLAVDFGRVESAKLQLHNVADAAARYASTGLSSSATLAYAEAVAAQNTVDVGSVTLQSGDVVTGTWANGAFTAGGYTPNAVQVTAHLSHTRGTAIPLLFGAIIGMPNCDVTAVSVATCTTTGGVPNFAGLSSITMGNNATFRSYDSSIGTPGGSNVGDNALVGSNGTVTFANASTVDGSINLGPSGSSTHGSNYTITGSQSTESSALTYTPTESPTVASSGSLTYGNNKTLQLAAGTYNYDSITAGSSFTLQFTGPATLYVTGSLSFTGATTIIAYKNIPSNLQIRLVGNASIVQTGNGFVGTGEVYGPSASFSAGGGCIFDGSMIVNTITTGVGAYFNSDDEIGGGGSGGSTTGAISTVQ